VPVHQTSAQACPRSHMQQVDTVWGIQSVEHVLHAILGKHVTQESVKNITCQQCHVKEECTEECRNSDNRFKAGQKENTKMLHINWREI
jgi:hypothetical protein